MPASWHVFADPVTYSTFYVLYKGFKYRIYVVSNVTRPTYKFAKKLFDYFRITSMFNSIFMYRACEVCFLTAASDEQNRIGFPYFPRQLGSGHSS